MHTLWVASRTSALLALMAVSPALSQVVQDDFSDGDFTSDPAWSGDVDRFVVAVSDTLNWLRSDGLEESGFIYLSTASTVASGTWRFRFRHSDVNLSNFNGSRIYLVADAPDLMGEVHGYYLQFGMNNLNRVELYRQDGPAESRLRLGVSDVIVPGDSNSVFVEVTRDDLYRWTVFVDGEPVIYQIEDATYTHSQALGVWVRHTAAGRDRFFWTSFLADPDPGDITPPTPTAVTPTSDGQTLYVAFDEALDPVSVVADAFTIEPESASAVSAELTDHPTLVRVELDVPLIEGSYDLVVSGVADLAGNVQHLATIAFTVSGDVELPELAYAEALSATEIRVVYDRPVFGCDTELYSLLPLEVIPASITCHDLVTYDLELPFPLPEQAIYTVVASGVEDLTGAIQPETSADFFFGTFAIPGERDIVINEVMYAPDDVHTNEYVELYNRTDNDFFDLSTLRFANATSPPRVITAGTEPLGPGQYAVLVRDPAAFKVRFPGTAYFHVAQFPALLNGGDTPQLLRDDGVVIDAVPYRPAWGGLGPALERLDPNGPSHHAANWGDSQHPSGGTPGEQNSIYLPDTWPPVPLSVEPSNDGLSLRVVFDEPLDPTTVTPEAFSLSDGPPISEAKYLEDLDFAVFLNLGSALMAGTYTLFVSGVQDLVGNVTEDAIDFNFTPDLDPPGILTVRAVDAFRIRVLFDEPLDEGSATLATNYTVSGGIGAPDEAQMLSPAEVQLDLPAALTGPTYYELTVENVADVHGNAIEQLSALFFYGEPESPEPGDIVINEIMYAPAEVHSNEYVELANVSEKVVDLAELILADQGAGVSISTEPHLLPPGELVVLVRNASAFAETFPGAPFTAVHGFPTLLNGGDAVVVRHEVAGAITTIDSVFYQPAWGGQGRSLERRNADGPSHSPMNWLSSIDPRGGTPAEPNSVPPDESAPEALAVEVTPGGMALIVHFDEPLAPETVIPSNFLISDVGAPADASYEEEDGFIAMLALADPLEGGSRTLTINGVADWLGNATDGTTISFNYEPDLIPPEIASVTGVDSLTVQVRFTEIVTPESATQTSHYGISSGIGEPDKVTYAPAGDLTTVHLHLAGLLTDQTLYTLTVSGVADLAGNVQPGTEAFFILGDGDIPLTGDIAINEIMFRPADGQTEYVELRNATDKTFDLSGFTISDEGQPRSISATPIILPPHGIVAIARSLDLLRDHFGSEAPAIQMSSLPTLRVAGDAVVLRHEGVTVDSVYYSPDWHRPELRDHRGVALERMDPALSSNDPGNWTSSLHSLGGTPGLANSVAIPPGVAPEAPGLTVSPSPFDASTGTVIRFRLESEGGVVRIRIFDTAGRLVRTLEQAALSGNAVEHEVIWNGRNDANQALRMGPYVVLLEALDLAGARTEAHRAIVVLARQMR